jgi:tetratricopeptide (TPR) repeat protein
MRIFSRSWALLLLLGAIVSTPSTSAIQVVPEFDPAAEYRQGIAALQAGRYEDAKRLFEHVLTVVPHDAQTNLLAGLANEGLGDFRGAQTRFEQAVRANPALIPARRELGLTYLRLGQRTRAEEQLAGLNRLRIECAANCPRAAEIAGAIEALSVALRRR